MLGEILVETLLLALVYLVGWGVLSLGIEELRPVRRSTIVYAFVAYVVVTVPGKYALAIGVPGWVVLLAILPGLALLVVLTRRVRGRSRASAATIGLVVVVVSLLAVTLVHG